YRIYGYKGKQVRDNIHAYDVASFIQHFIHEPRCGEVYNLGGGRGNSCSILEAFEAVVSITGKKMNYEYIDKHREGDHICYISDLTKMRTHYPSWDLTMKLPTILEEICSAWSERWGAPDLAAHSSQTS
ncbi:MAG: NAD-dependent epimerase/dehydratase family protein, partial [Nitrospiraceae bacterium]